MTRYKKNAGFATRAIHVGQSPEAVTGAVVPPLHQTSTFRQKNFAEYTYDYSRADNPTRHNLEQTIASLEEGVGAVAFGSGLAAESAIFSLLNAGDHIILSENVYGGTFRLLDKVFRRFSLNTSWVDTGNIRNIQAARTPETRMVFIETPTNPMMQLTDIRQVADWAQEESLILVVDNTFMSPYYQRPISLGARIVVHSTTKYLNGHSDVVGGVVITDDEDILEKLRFIQMSVGAVPGPFDCWLTQRSLKTLAIRMETHNRNAMTLAQHLEASGKIRHLYYPGLKSHPQYELATRQQTDPSGKAGFGGMISIDLGSMEKARQFVRALNVFTLAESLGGVESLVCHPASMTHASVPAEKRLAMKLTDGLVRLSVGIENVEDLEADIISGLETL